MTRLRGYTKAKEDVEAALPGVLDMAGTMAPLGLPSTFT